MLYVQLDTNWPDHPKIIRAGIEGAGLHAIILCLAKRLEKDGWVDRTLLYRQGASDPMIDRLVELDLLEDGDDAVRPDGWLDRNPSQAAIEAERAAKKEAGRRGNHAKWDHPGSYESCPRCNPKPLVVAHCDQVGSEAIATDRTPTKQSKSEVATAIGGAIDPLAPETISTGKEALAAIRSGYLQAVPNESNHAGSGNVTAARPPAARSEGAGA